MKDLNNLIANYSRNRKKILEASVEKVKIYKEVETFTKNVRGDGVVSQDERDAINQVVSYLATIADEDYKETQAYVEEIDSRLEILNKAKNVMNLEDNFSDIL